MIFETKGELVYVSKPQTFEFGGKSKEKREVCIRVPRGEYYDDIAFQYWKGEVPFKKANKKEGSKGDEVKCEFTVTSKFNKEHKRFFTNVNLQKISLANAPDNQVDEEDDDLPF